MVQKRKIKKPRYTKSSYRLVSKQDKKRKAKKPGYRVSASGNRYYEARPNRSDLFRKLGY